MFIPTIGRRLSGEVLPVANRAMNQACHHAENSQNRFSKLCEKIGDLALGTTLAVGTCYGTKTGIDLGVETYEKYPKGTELFRLGCFVQGFTIGYMIGFVEGSVAIPFLFGRYVYHITKDALSESVQSSSKKE
jgi:hypothetical protein